MRRLLTIFVLLLLSNLQIFSQTYNVVADLTGVKPTTAQLADLELASDSAKLELPTTLQPKFKVYDFGFYSLSRNYEGGFDAVWEKVKTDVDAKAESDYYIIFGRESSDAGPNMKIRVELVLPRTSQFECLTEERRNNVEKYVQAVANQNLSNSIYEAEVKALEMLRAYIYKIVQCECTGIRTSCDLSLDYKYIDPELMGLGFRKKEITIGDTCSWTNGTQEIHDYFGKQVIIDGQPYCITEQISVGKSLIEASQQVLPDTTIATSVSGKVFILDNESFTNGEWDNAKSQAGQHDYVEYWVIVKDNKTNKYYLYSKFSLEAMDAVALRGGGGDGTRGIAGIVPTWGDALKALGNAAVDATLQAVIFRIVDPSVKDWGDAWGKVSYFGAAWEGIASLIPWKDKLTGPQEFVVRAAASAFTVVLDNYTRNKASYTVNQALIDFGIGFGASAITQLVFHPKVTEVIGSNTKYAYLAFSKGVKRIYDSSTGFLYNITKKAFKSLTGTITKRTLNETTDAALIARVKSLRGKLLSDDKKKGNFGLANVNVSGVTKKEFFASSRVNDLTNTTLRERLPDISVLPSNEIFPWSTIANKAGDAIDRNIDAEYKILTEIAQKLGDNVNASGTIKLFTERDMCNSCANVLGLFSSIYKKINIEVIHNNGNLLIP